jgi:imidazolonepropionase-like amidohydrolase
VYLGEGRVISPGFVLIRDSQIRAVGEGSSSEEETVVDFGEATILPGLIDSHCHITLSGDGRTYEEQVLDPDEMMTLIAVSNMRRHLESGVTTLRDNGGRNRTTFVVREAIKRGYVTGPRLLLSGRPLTHSSGHFFWCNGVADGEVAIRAAVRGLVAEGADHIKIMASGGATLGNLPYFASYNVSELRCAVEAAHALDRATTAHCRARQSMVNAVEAGCDCIEHAEFLVPGEMMQLGEGVPASGRMVYDPAVTERMLEAGTYVSFTLQAGGYPTLRGLRARRAGGDALSPGEQSRLGALEALFEMKMVILANLMRDGMKPRLVISTDAGPFDVAFGALQDGLELGVAAGMSPSEAIDAATCIAAKACNIEDAVGGLESGLDADVLVVDGNPLVDIRDLRRVRQVFRRGRAVIAEVSLPTGAGGA